VQRPSGLPVDTDLDFARDDDVEAVAVFSLADDLPSRGNVERL
jgi:hypothetical protein